MFLKLLQRSCWWGRSQREHFSPCLWSWVPWVLYSRLVYCRQEEDLSSLPWEGCFIAPRKGHQLGAWSRARGGCNVVWRDLITLRRILCILGNPGIFYFPCTSVLCSSFFADEKNPSSSSNLTRLKHDAATNKMMRRKKEDLHCRGMCNNIFRKHQIRQIKCVANYPSTVVMESVKNMQEVYRKEVQDRMAGKISVS